MRNFLFWIKNKKRSLIYSVFLFFAFELILKIYQEFGRNRFLISSAFFGIILLAQLFYGIIFIRKRYTRFEISQVIWPLVRVHLLHQIILPLLLYFGMVSLIFFYPSDILVHLMILTITATFWLLFLNIRSVYDHDFELRHLSHGIYNLVYIFVFFLITLFSLEFSHYFRIDPILIAVTIFFVSILLLMMTLNRYFQTNVQAVFMVLIFSAFIAILSWYLGGLIFTNYFNLALNITIIYYLISSIISHKAEGTLEISILVEYFAVALLSIIILSNKFI